MPSRQRCSEPLFESIAFLGDLYRCYQTSYFALEWGKLFQQGLEIRQIIMCMQQTSTATLVQELAVQLELCLASGGLLPDKLRTMYFDARVFIDCVPGRNAWEIRRRIVCL